MSARRPSTVAEPEHSSSTTRGLQTGTWAARRHMRRRMMLYVVVMAVVASIFVSPWIDYPIRSHLPSAYARPGNATWIAHTWVEDAHTSTSIADLATELAANNIQYVYAHVGPVEKGGLIPPEKYAHAKQLVAGLKSTRPQLHVLAWVGGLNQATGGDVDLTDKDTRQNISTQARSLVVDDGFDGIHLDIEPLPNGRRDFLVLLQQVRQALGQWPVLSVAITGWSPAAAPSWLPFPFWDRMWDTAYLRQVAEGVDQLVVMSYDTPMPSRNLFIQYVRAQTAGILRSLDPNSNVQVLMGVPTFGDSRTGIRAEAESISAGLEGVTQGLQMAKDGGRLFSGVALYPHWETSAAEWQEYSSNWPVQ